MGIKDFLKEELERDVLLRGFRKLRRPKTSPDVWYYRQAQAHLNPWRRNFSPATAIAHLKEGMRLAPHNALYHATLGQVFLLTPAWAVTRGCDVSFSISRAAELAKTELEKTISLAPDYIEVYYYLALSHEYLGKREEAKRVCQRALEQSPPKEMKDFLTAYLEALAKLSSSSFPDREQKALGHLKQAISYRDQGKFKLADNEFEQACQAAPDSTWLYNTMCRLATHH